MSKNFVIVEDDDLNLAVAKGCKTLGCTVEEVEVKVLKPGKKGLIFSTPYKVKISKNTIEVKESKYKNRESKILSDLEDVESFLSNRDGSIHFEKNSDGIFITVNPPAGNGRAVSIDEVHSHVKEDTGIINVDNIAINKAFLPMNYGQSMRIADYLEDIAIDLDSKINVFVTTNKMQVKIKISPPKGNGNKPTLEDVILALKNNSVMLPPDEEIILNMLDCKKFNEEIVVVKGVIPENGEDSSVNWVVGELDKTSTQVIRKDGSVDFKKIFDLNNVHADTLLGVFKSPTLGKSGKNVLGEVIEAKPGRERQIKVGNNVRISDDGEKYYSIIDGQFSKEHGLGNVFPVYEVKGDLDYSEGNIDFFGTVVIHGQVRSGFEVKAGGNICVMKTVGEAKLIAGGQVIVSGGFIGKEKGIIKAGSDVLLKFAEGGNIEAGEDVIVDNAVMHCNVVCGGKVEVKSRKGQIVGGSILARDEVYAKNIGTILGTKTYITVGIDTITIKKLEHLEELMNESELKMAKLQQSLNHLTNIEESEGQLNQNQIQLSSQVKSAYDSIRSRFEEIIYEKETVEANLNRKRKGVVRAYETIFSGVHVTIRNVKYHVKTDIKASSLVLDGENVRISTL